jgi:hypothetical protein
MHFLSSSTYSSQERQLFRNRQRRREILDFWLLTTFRHAFQDWVGQNSLSYIFELFLQETGNKPSKEQVQTFVDDNFDSEGSEFEDWEPSDWKPDIALLNNINVLLIFQTLSCFLKRS